eukprot:m.54218 g.54218  ORF g.54218 m.54218 type:complete len:310 (-) comp15496_c0_seq1:257-1186(-)
MIHELDSATCIYDPGQTQMRKIAMASANVLCLAGIIAAVVCPSQGTSDLRSGGKLLALSKTSLVQSSAILRKWQDFEAGQRTIGLRKRRQSTCNESLYFESIDTSGVDMTEFEKYSQQCASFFDNFENAVLNGSVCADPCLQPSLDFFRLAASGTGGGNCSEFKDALNLATSLFEDVTCPTNEVGSRCGDVLQQIDSDIYVPPQCAAINNIGCCYNKLLDIFDNPTFKRISGITLPVNETILDSAQQNIRSSCGSGFPYVFSASCASATPGNGIAESNIKSGISSASFLAPSVSALAMALLLSLAALMV